MSTYSRNYSDARCLNTHELDIGPFCAVNAEKYDLEASYMGVRYGVAHKVQNSIVKKHLYSIPRKNPLVLDVGCGTGTDGMDILSESNWIRYVGIDRSPHMLAVAKKKHKDYIARGQSHFIELDFLKVANDSLEKFFKGSNIDSKVECVISSLAFHHYGDEKRCNIYKHLHQILSEGGLFILTDLFTSSLGVCCEYALDEEVRDINKSILKLEKHGHFSHKDTTLSVNHYLNENILGTIRTEFNLLTSAGFKSVDVVYRDAQLAVIVALKDCQ